MNSSESFVFVAGNVSDTVRAGQAIAAAAEPRTVIGLTGTLGAGKTLLVQAVAEGLGIDRRTVVSPTFSLVQSYAGRIPLVHIDAWRIRDDDEFIELGLDEMLESDSLIMIEWAEKFAILLPDHRLGITVEILNDDSRQLHFSWVNQAGPAATLGKRLRSILGPGGDGTV
jgi:tRNA threonylcarbamoyladenosine biosynthesis protein TsaE